MAATINAHLVDEPAGGSPETLSIHIDNMPEGGGDAPVAAAVAGVSAADCAAAAADAPTKAEFDAVVALANECKATLNAALSSLAAAGLMSGA